MKVYLEHNPFLIQTFMTRDGKSLPPEHPLEEQLNNRLQQWVDSFFTDLYDNFKDKKIELEFKGVLPDFEDLQAAAIHAKQIDDALDIVIKHIPVTPADERLNQLKTLIEQTKSEPIELLRNNSDFQKEYEAAIDPAFDINVIATMSSGKSTVINSMLGQEILPAKNNATTATIARIYDKDGAKGFRAKRLNKTGVVLDNWRDVTQHDIETWNGDEQTAEIVIEGDILGIDEQEHASLVLVDTPGPNNSRNENHRLTTQKLISERSLSMVLYILNAENSNSNDDKALLEAVRDQIQQQGKEARDRIIFLINKIDATENEEGPEVAIQKSRKDLTENGIDNPILIPVSARLTLWQRKTFLGRLLTDDEQDEFSIFKDSFIKEGAMHLLQYMNVSPSVKKQAQAMLNEAKNKKDEDLEASIHAGIPVVELVIQEYLNKYAYPIKLTKVQETVKRFLDSAKKTASLTADIQATEENLQQVQNYIAEVQAKMANSADKERFRAEVKKEHGSVEEAFSLKTRVLDRAFDAHKRILADILSESEVMPSTARKKMDEAKAIAENFSNTAIIQLEDAMKDIVAAEQQRLKQVYAERLSELMSVDEELDIALPVVKSLKSAALSLSNTASFLHKATEKKQVVVGEKVVSTSVWYNPFTWGDTSIEKVYETKELVDLNEVWKAISKVVSNSHYALLTSARAEMSGLIKNTKNQFVEIMDSNLDQQVQNLMTDLEVNTKNLAELEKAQHTAKLQLESMLEFEAKLNAIIEL
ncbi:MAG: dynamin family protein [Thiomicrospira sp.]|jgi:GTPase Era involved in 16S rRNA processing|nr:dynamin family protein [Thiomicrospira sp.]